MSQDVTLKEQNAQAHLVLLIIGATLPVTVWYRCRKHHLLAADLRLCATEQFFPLLLLLLTFYKLFTNSQLVKIPSYVRAYNERI